MKEKQIEEELNLNIEHQKVELFTLLDFLYFWEFNEMFNELKGGKQSKDCLVKKEYD